MIPKRLTFLILILGLTTFLCCANDTVVTLHQNPPVQEDEIAVLKQEIKTLKSNAETKQKKLEELVKAKEKSRDWDFATWVSILLACVGIGITILGIMLAVLTFIGYKNLERRIIGESSKKAEEKADKTVNLMIDDSVEKVISKMVEEEKFDKYFVSLIERIAYSGIGPLNTYEDIDTVDKERE